LLLQAWHQVRLCLQQALPSGRCYSDLQHHASDGGPTMTSLNVPNIDAMTADELRKLSNELLHLSTYANLKAQAMERRAEGEINAALRAEALCEQLYQTLPDEWRW
jgi:hypothetical protein